jgi:glycine hydroxymethyltransferase
MLAADPQVADLVAAEERRQAEHLVLIPSENHTSAAVRAASGSVLSDKYSEGYAGRR